MLRANQVRREALDRGLVSISMRALLPTDPIGVRSVGRDTIFLVCTFVFLLQLALALLRLQMKQNI